MTAVLVVGGYGAVGRHAAASLLAGDPRTEVVVAGRRPDTAHPVPGARAVRLDVSDPGALADALAGVGTVLMCAPRGNAQVARASLERGIDYLDVSASHQVLTEVERLDPLARDTGATALLSVGLVPGLSNLLARQCARRAPGHEVRIGVLLGSGEHHGRAAVEWTVDGLGQLTGSWSTTFPDPFGTRVVHRFPFSDQYTVPATAGIGSVATGLCLDSRFTTSLLAAARRPVAARVLRHRAVRAIVLGLLTRIHLGGDAFALTVQAGPVRASVAGHGQSRATGITAARLIGALPTLPTGVRHIDQVVEPAPFLRALAEHGLTLDLP